MCYINRCFVDKELEGWMLKVTDCPILQFV